MFLLVFLAIFLIGCDVSVPEPYDYKAPYKYRIYNDWLRTQTISYISFEMDHYGTSDKKESIFPESSHKTVHITLRPGEYSALDSTMYRWISLCDSTFFPYNHWDIMTTDSVNIIKL